MSSKYYKSKLQPIDIIQTLNLNFNIANVVKYIHRCKNKNGIDDLKKAINYLEFEINNKSAIIENIIKYWSDNIIDEDLKKALVSYLSSTKDINLIYILENKIKELEKISKS